LCLFLAQTVKDRSCWVSETCRKRFCHVSIYLQLACIAVGVSIVCSGQWIAAYMLAYGMLTVCCRFTCIRCGMAGCCLLFYFCAFSVCLSTASSHGWCSKHLSLIALAFSGISGLRC